MKPIRKDLLIHTVTYKPKTDDDDGWGGGTPPTPQTLKHVRVEPKETFVRMPDGRQVTSNTTLLIDNTFSTKPTDGIQFEDAIDFEGRTYMVQSVDTYYARTNTVHHWEVRLA